MSEPTDPPRIVDVGSEASERLKKVVEESRANVGNETEVKALEARLTPLLWPAPGTSASTSGSTAGAKASGALALKVGAALVIAGTAGVWLTREHTLPVPGPTPLTSARPATEIPAPRTVEVPAVEITDGAPNAFSPSLREHKSVTPDSVSESELLGQAQAALTADPSRALALAEKHRRLFAHGVLAQEREVIAIEALTRLGRNGEAKTRADRFLKAHPGSAYRNKLESLESGR